jgi:peptidoglycan hydrolase CwlO-like protein
MTIPAKYTLTEANWIIATQEKEIEGLDMLAKAMMNQVDDMAIQRIKLNAQIKELEEDLRDERNDCVQDQAYIVKLKARIKELEEEPNAGWPPQ